MECFGIRAGFYARRNFAKKLNCPWQNGRIERFFGTSKKYLRRWQFEGRLTLDGSLAEFAAWYNDIRPHQSLGGLTPLEAWKQVNPFHAPAPPRAISFVKPGTGCFAGFIFDGEVNRPGFHGGPLV